MKLFTFVTFLVIVNLVNPIVGSALITAETTGTYQLFPKDGSNSSESFVYNSNNFSSLLFTINFDKSLYVSISFVITESLKQIITGRNLHLLSPPITISSNETFSWRVLYSFPSGEVQKDLVSFYYVTNSTFMVLPTTIQPPEQAVTNSYKGNGTYVLLGKFVENNSLFYGFIIVIASYVFFILLVVTIALFLYNRLRG